MNTGVIIRASGQVIIDNWTAYGPPPSVSQPAGGPPTAFGVPSPSDYPKGITLGKSVHDETLICAEDEASVKCMNLKQIRALIKAGK